MRNRYNNYVIEEERSIHENQNTSMDNHIPGEDKEVAHQEMNYQDMEDDMFDIQISPVRSQNINFIQSSLTSNRGTIKKSDSKQLAINDNQ